MSRAACLLLLALLLAPAQAWGQGAASPAVQAGAEKVAPGVDAKDLDELLHTLEDPQARERLIRQVRALRAAKEAGQEEGPGLGATLMQAMSEGLAHAGARGVAVVEEAANVRGLWGWLQRQAVTPERRSFWISTFVTVTVVFGAGLLAALLLRWLLMRPRRSIEQRGPRDGLGRIELLGMRTLIEVAPIVAFALAAYGALAFVAPQKPIRLVALAVVNAALLARVLLAGARMVLAPVATSLRIPRISDSTAGYLYVWTGRLVHVIVYGYFLAEAARLLGVSHAGERTIANLVGLVVAAELFVLVLQNRTAVAAWIRGHARPRRRRGLFAVLRSRFADVWHVLASVYILAVYVVWALDVHEGFWRVARGTLGTMLAIAVARLLIDLAGRGVDRLFQVSPELRERLPGLEARVDRYEPVARTVLAVAIGIAAAVASLEAWGVHAAEALASPVGQDLLGRLVKILLIALVAVAAWEVANLLIARALTRAGGTSAQRSQRSRTLLPLTRHALSIVISVLAGMTVLSELGVNIGPLLAGAGVLGLAVGFGAQTLVKDVITGAFILFEDAISVGDVVEVAGYAGLVEAITLRTIRHRDLSGTVHTIPFSSVTVVRNLTKDFSYYLMDIGVAYREDTDEVVEVVCALLEEMREDPDYRDAILAPLEVLGVNSFGDSAVMVRARIKTKPLEQWRVGREFNRRMKHRFDELDIEIPFPHRTLYFGVTKDGTAPPGHLRIEPEKRKEPEGEGAASGGSAPAEAPRAAGKGAGETSPAA